MKWLGLLNLGDMLHDSCGDQLTGFVTDFQDLQFGATSYIQY